MCHYEMYMSLYSEFLYFHFKLTHANTRKLSQSPSITHPTSRSFSHTRLLAISSHTLGLSLSPCYKTLAPLVVSLSPTLTLSLTHTHSLSHTHTLSLSHTHTHSHSHSQTHTQTLSPSNMHTHCLSLTHTHSLSPSNIHTHSLSHTHTHTLSFKHGYSFKELNSPASFKDGHIL